MCVIFCLLAIFCIQTLGEELLFSDQEGEIHNRGGKPLIIDSIIKGIKQKFNLQKLEFVHSNPYVVDLVFFYLYTRENKNGYLIKINDSSLLGNSTFKPSRKTKVVIHGFNSNHMSESETRPIKAYLVNQDVNIVGVDWSELSPMPNYFAAVGFCLGVGEVVAQLIDFLVTVGGANISEFHLIGHSLGAHVASFAANNVTTGRITRISGLDPAYPLFSPLPPDQRLDPTDANVVDCIHTCGGILGFYDPLGTHDFYPNGGLPLQPGCSHLINPHLILTCPHARAYELFASSIANVFPAQACSSFNEVKKNSCTGNWTGFMGEPAPTAPAGIYYLKTTGSHPYVLKHDQLRNTTTKL